MCVLTTTVGIGCDKNNANYFPHPIWFSSYDAKTKSRINFKGNVISKINGNAFSLFVQEVSSAT